MLFMKLKTSDLVKYTRLAVGETQEQFAKRIGKKRTDIAKYEAGKNIPPGDVVLKIIEIKITTRKSQQ